MEYTWAPLRENESSYHYTKVGSNNMLMLKVCKSLQKCLQTFAIFCKLLQVFGTFILFYFILHVREAQPMSNMFLFCVFDVFFIEDKNMFFTVFFVF